jgi:hypothetical protein
MWNILHIVVQVGYMGKKFGSNTDHPFMYCCCYCLAQIAEARTVLCPSDDDSGLSSLSEYAVREAVETLTALGATLTEQLRVSATAVSASHVTPALDTGAADGIASLQTQVRAAQYLIRKLWSIKFRDRNSAWFDALISARLIASASTRYAMMRSASQG